MPREVLGQLLAHYLNGKSITINRWMYRNSMKMLSNGDGEDPRMAGIIYTTCPAVLDEIDIARASQDSEKIKRARIS